MDQRPRAKYQLEGRFSVAAPDVDVADVAWNPGGDQVAVLAAMVRRVNVFRIPDGTRVASQGDFAGGALSLAWTSDGRVVIPPLSGSRGLVSLFDPNRGSSTSVPMLSDDDVAGGSTLRFAIRKMWWCRWRSAFVGV